MLFDPVAVLPAGGREQPGLRALQPARVPRDLPGEGIVLDEGGTVHARVKGDVELVKRVRAVRALRYALPRPLRGEVLAVGDDVPEDTLTGRVARRIESVIGIVGRPDESRSIGSYDGNGHGEVLGLTDDIHRVHNEGAVRAIDGEDDLRADGCEFKGCVLA